MMKNIYIVLVWLILLPIGLFAQTNISYNLGKYMTTETSLPNSHFLYNMDLENSEVYVLRSNGALIDWIQNDSNSNFSHLYKKESNILTQSFYNQNTVGSYIHYNGKRQTFGELLAGGERRIKNIGTLYGMASYKNGSRRNTCLNYSIHPQDYAPYFVSDTLGKRNMNQEIYTVMSGFSFPYKTFQLGVDAFYEGIAQANTKDPRHSNYSHLARIGFSLGKIWSHNAIALKIAPEWNRQSISAKSLQEGVRYFDFYGFGLWNRRESKGAIAYGRIQTLQGIFANANWTHGGLWNWTISTSYQFRTMNTEESSFKNLFSSITNHFQQHVILNRNFEAWKLYFQLTATENVRNGAENVYEQQIQNKEQGLYDYVKVGTNKLYNNSWYTGALFAKMIYFTTPTSSFGIIAGSRWNYNQERYKSPVMKIRNQTLTAILGAEYKQRKAKSQLEIGTYTHLQNGWNNQYNLLGNDTELQTITTFIPYQIRGENHQVFSGNISYSFDITTRYTIGIRFAANYLNSDYRQVYGFKTDLFLTF